MRLLILDNLRFGIKYRTIYYVNVETIGSGDLQMKVIKDRMLEFNSVIHINKIFLHDIRKNFLIQRKILYI